MIEKEFIPYEQALALKELGFDEPCFGWYSKDGTFYEGKMTIHQGLLCAPTFSQCFRWFREKYGYWCYIKEATKGTCRFYVEKFDEKFFNSEIYNFYEEAELACLLKLIEIVKKK